MIDLIRLGTIENICPVCTVAVTAGVTLSKYIGVDDSITGVWLGALLANTVIYFNAFLKQRLRLYHKAIRSILSIILIYGSSLATLYWTNFIGNPLNKLFGVDKLILGIVTGTVVFISSVKIHFILKRKNNNHVYFPFQKVVIPVLSLIAVSIILNLLCRQYTPDYICPLN